MSFQKIIVMGNLGKNPELRETQSGKAVANFSVATNEFRSTNGGEREKVTEWHNIVAWDRTAENVAKYLKKGSQCLVEGRIQTRSWEDRDGNKRYTTEIVANNVQFIGRKGDLDETQASTEADGPTDDMPF